MQVLGTREQVLGPAPGAQLDRSEAHLPRGSS